MSLWFSGWPHSLGPSLPPCQRSRTRRRRRPPPPPPGSRPLVSVLDAAQFVPRKQPAKRSVAPFSSGALDFPCVVSIRSDRGLVSCERR